MKKIILTLLAALAVSTVSAQNLGSYFMEGTAHRLQLNPAFAPRQGYFNIPVAGSLHIGMTGNVAVGDIFFPYDGKLVSLLDKHITASQALRGLQAKNGFALDARTGLFSFGAFTRNNRSFWSFDLNLRAEAEANVPKSLVDFVKNGGEHMTIRNLGLSARAYAEAAFSYSFRITDKIYLGARGKFIAGLLRERMAIDRMDITLTGDEWIVDGRGSFESSGYRMNSQEREDGTEYYGFKDAKFYFDEPAGYGFGIDVGATYDVLDNLQVSLAVNDLGFIAWSKNATARGHMDKYQSFAGANIIDGKPDTPKFDLGKFEFEKDASEGVTESLHTSINAGGEYKLWNRKVGLGLLYSARIWSERTYHNITASANYTPVQWFTVGANYSFLSNRGHSVGFAINVCPSWINFFLATDMLIGEHTTWFIPTKSTMMNVTVGLGIPIGKKNLRRLHKPVDPLLVLE